MVASSRWYLATGSSPSMVTSSCTAAMTIAEPARSSSSRTASEWTLAEPTDFESVAVFLVASSMPSISSCSGPVVASAQFCRSSSTVR
jgi:hypothetical protein